MMPERPVAGSPESAADARLVALARAAWRLGEIGAVRRLGGTFDRTLYIRAETGTWVLQLAPRWVSPARLDSIQRVRHALAGSDVPVSQAVLAAVGGFQVLMDDRLAELTPWLPADGDIDRWCRLEAAAGLLARFHDVLAGVEIAGFVPPPVSNGIPSGEYAIWLARTRGAVAAAPADAGDRAAALASCDRAEALHDRADGDGVPTLPTQLTHGDFGHGNVLFRDGTPAAIIDFEFTGMRLRIADLADLAFTPQWRPVFGQAAIPPAARDWSYVGRIVRKYDAQARTPLADAELAALPVAMARLPLVWLAQAALHADPVAAVQLVAPELATSAWLLDQRHRLAARWCRRVS